MSFEPLCFSFCHDFSAEVWLNGNCGIGLRAQSDLPFGIDGDLLMCISLNQNSFSHWLALVAVCLLG